MKQTSHNLTPGILFKICEQLPIPISDIVGISRCRILLPGSEIKHSLHIGYRPFIEEKSRSRQDISREILHRLLLAQHIHKCQTSIRIMADTGEINGISIHFHIKFGPSAQLCTRTNPVGSLSHTQRLHTGINSSCHTGTFILVYFGKRGIGQQRFFGQTGIDHLLNQFFLITHNQKVGSEITSQETVIRHRINTNLFPFIVKQL